MTTTPFSITKLGVILIILCSALAASNGLTAVEIAGPDGKVRFGLSASAGQLNYTVTFAGRPVIETSALVFSVDGVELTRNVAIGRAERSRHKESYPWRGVHSEAIDHWNGARIELKDAQSGAYTLEVRAFSDGVAFRWVVPGGATSRVPDEATKFVVPDGSILWYHGLNGHYEGVHQKKEVREIAAGEWAAPPMTFKLPGAAAYAAITEAALISYSGMALHADGKRGFELALGNKHPPSHPFVLRYSNDVTRVSKPASIVGAITTPWRVVMVGRDLNALVNSDIVPNLSPPPDPTLFPNGMRTEWIKPGRAVWKYVDGGANTLEGMKEFSRLAGELGFEYNILEGFWSKWSNEQIKELVEYSRRQHPPQPGDGSGRSEQIGAREIARGIRGSRGALERATSYRQASRSESRAEQGVGLWFWKHSKELRTAEQREAFFKKLHDLGVVGAKIDFFDHEHKEIIELYAELLKTAAQYHVLVNFHGANKPTGESRTWPNELNREAIKGMEASRLQDRARHDATLPFTRFLAGHADYTPVHFGTRRGDTTWAHQIATAAVFTAPLLTYAAHPTNLLANPAAPMIKNIPAVWDETIVLPVSEIGELAAFARRSGDVWFLALVNGPAAKTLTVPLSFLKRGSYQALIVSDRADNPASLRMEQRDARRTESMRIELASGGGFIARFTRGSN